MNIVSYDPYFQVSFSLADFCEVRLDRITSWILFQNPLTCVFACVPMLLGSSEMQHAIFHHPNPFGQPRAQMIFSVDPR
jgi:hypothetical protein